MDENTSATTRRSLVEEREATSEGRVSLAGAHAAIKAVSLLNKAFRESGISRQELAQRLGVGNERVNEILDGNGNLRITTIARVFKVLGYNLTLVPIEETS